jgi:hypothetical protein
MQCGFLSTSYGVPEFVAKVQTVILSEAKDPCIRRPVHRSFASLRMTVFIYVANLRNTSGLLTAREMRTNFA